MNYLFVRTVDGATQIAARVLEVPNGSLTIVDEKATLTLSGTITATAGSIGGWDITATSINKNGLTLGSNGVIYVGAGNWGNSNTGFYVDGTGKFSLKDKLTWDGTTLIVIGTVTATAGAIGDWAITSGYLVKDTGINSTSAGMAPTDFPFFAGATYANRATAPFRVNPAGAITATAGQFSGQVKALSGTIGGWTMTGSQIITPYTIVGGSFTGNTFTKSGSAAWDAGYSSYEAIIGDGYISWTATETTTDRMVGLSTSNSSAHFNTIAFAIYMSSAPDVQIYESGTLISSHGSYTASTTTFAIERVGTTLKYYKNGSAVRTVNGVTTAPIFVDTSVFTNAGTIGPVSIGHGAVGSGNVISSAGIKFSADSTTASISIGTTPPTSASAGTGIWLDKTGLYGLLSNVVQAKMDAATGAITAGAGAVTLDVNGLSFEQGGSLLNQLKFNSSGSAIAWMFSRRVSSTLYDLGLQLAPLTAEQEAAEGTFAIENRTGSSLDGISQIWLRRYGRSHATKAAQATLTFTLLQGNDNNTGRVLIANDSGEAVASAILELKATNGALLLTRLTTTQRDALTATNGMILYNSTLGKVQARAAGAWVDLH